MQRVFTWSLHFSENRQLGFPTKSIVSSMVEIILISKLSFLKENVYFGDLLFKIYFLLLMTRLLT